MTDDRRMKDIPMLDIDRERMREEFENFDNMTVDEWRVAVKKRQNELLDTLNLLSSPVFKPGDRVEDKEGDTGTVTRVEGGRVYVNGDAGGTSEWSYRPDELILVDE